MNGEGDLSSASIVSSISAVSSIHRPQPPDGPKPLRQPFQAHKSKVVRSPYLATSTPHAKRKQKSAPPPSHPHPHPSLSLSPSNGHTPQSASIAKSKWTTAVKTAGFVPESWPTQYHPSTSSFLQTLMNTQSFNFANVVGAAATRNTKKKQTSSPRNTDHHDPRDLQDEIVALKKNTNAANRERDLARAKLRRLEEELGKKDRQIEDLLSTGHIPSQDVTRSLAGTGKASSSSSSSAMSSLRQRVLTLERSLREKEKALTSLQEDLRSTRLKELEIETETYFREVYRLKVLLEAQMREAEKSATVSHTLREAQVRITALNKALSRQSARLELKESENRQLRDRLGEERGSVEPFRHRESGLRGATADKYADFKRGQMLRALVDMELKLQEKDNVIQSMCHEFEQERVQYESTSQRASSEEVKILRERLAEVESGRDKLRGVVKKLKEDRTHYRSLADKTQAELQQAVRDRLSHEELSLEVPQELDTLRQSHRNEMKAREHARKIAKQGSRLFSPNSTQQTLAATTLQRQWRRKQATKRQERFQAKMENAAINIQNALRAHITRKTHLHSPSHSHTPTSSHPHTPTHVSSEENVELSDSSDVAIETIQSALRAYHTRQMALPDEKNSVEGWGSEGENQWNGNPIGCDVRNQRRRQRVEGGVPQYHCRLRSLSDDGGESADTSESDEDRDNFQN